MLLSGGMALGSLGGFDTAAREHFAGYKSHSMMLAGVPAVGVGASSTSPGPRGRRSSPGR